VTAIVTARINRNPFMRMPFLLESGIPEAHLFNDPFGGNVPCERERGRGSFRVVDPGSMGASSEKQEADSPPRNRLASLKIVGEYIKKGANKDTRPSER
jgi:hypothetical protein